MILDGYGLNDKCEHNAVCEAKTPIMDQLMSRSEEHTSELQSR